ncbi:MAG: class I SAM-dependent methyltransferase [Solirubrobacteraceae bacterium]
MKAADDHPLPEELASQGWYGTFELAPGVETPGWFDLRPVAPKLPFPRDMSGMRCLDVGTFEGFWALEMHRRGAREVLGIDILDPWHWDWPVGSDEAVVRALEERKRGGAGFETVRAALDHSVERRELSAYDIDESAIGRFDFVYVGSLLVHLRDPVRALERVRSVLDGHLLLCDLVHLPNSLRRPRTPMAQLDGRGRPWWWRPNLAALLRLAEAAGFERAARPRLVFLPPGAAHPRPSLRAAAVLRTLGTSEGRELLFASRFGAPHVALLLRPRR